MDPPNWYRHPQHSTILAHPVFSNLSMSPMAARGSPGRQLIRTCRKPAQICRTARKYTNMSNLYRPGESKVEAENTKKGFAGLREGV